MGCLVLGHMSPRLKLGSYRKKKAGVWLLASSCRRHNFCMHYAVVSVAAKTLATKVWLMQCGGGTRELPDYMC